MKNSKKIKNDKYYTPKHVAEKVYNITMEVIGKENITEIIEPSAGAGVFLELDDRIIGYDIEPEHEKVIKQDFLTLDIEYKKGRLVLGNPPYGTKLFLAQDFYQKAVEIADYIAFILPISQLDNNITMYEFDLIYSVDLGKEVYSDRKLHCCFNIYKRPINGLNKKPKYSLKDITIVKQDQKIFDNFEYDIRICHWGTNAGKILKEGERYAGEYKIKINNLERKEEIKTFIENFDWNNYIKAIATKSLYKHHIIKALKENIKDIK